MSAAGGGDGGDADEPEDGGAGESLQFAYQPAGPVSAAAYEDLSPVLGIMGPFGSGKTRMLASKLILKAALQPVSPVDGMRHYKAAIIRLTYRDLARSVISSWLEVVPKTYGKFTGGGPNAPSVHEITFDTGEFAGIIHMIVEFGALGDNNIEDFMRGFQPTDIWGNEADLLPPEFVDYADGRVGRYPSKQHGGAAFPQVLLDFNAPPTESWLYRKFLVDRPKGWKLYVQPSGLSPQAENVANLPPDYYPRISEGKPEWWVNRYVKNQWGYSRAGKPVYPEYRDVFHVAANPLAADPHLPIQVGMDAGGTPAAVFGQRLPTGLWRILGELVTPPTGVVGAKRFGDYVNDYIAKHFPDHRPVKSFNEMTGRTGFEAPIAAWCDPSAEYGADRHAGEQDWRQMVEAKVGFRIKGTATNSPETRHEAVRMVLTRQIDGEPGFVLSPVCTVLRMGFNSGYRFRRKQLVGQEEYHETVDDNHYTHVHDALQYMILGGGEYHMVMERKSLTGTGPRQIEAITDDNPNGLWAGGGRPRFAVSE